MAAFHHHPFGSRTSHASGQQLPTGSCNFRDISLGQKAPVCGCKRYWLNEGHNGSNAERAWCFCGHHACFHDAFNKQQQSLVQSQFAEATGGLVEGYVQVSTEAERQARRTSQFQPRPTGLGIRAASTVPSQSVSTRLWDALNGFARDQEGPDSETSRVPSTACPSVAGEPRVSPARAMLAQSQRLRSMGPPVNIPQLYNNLAGSDEYSATEVATPSLNGTPILRPFATQPAPQPAADPVLLTKERAKSAPPRDDHADAASGRPANGSNRVPAPSMSPGLKPELSHHDMQNMLHVIQRRIDVLEGLSFSHVPVEEVQERFDLFEGRVLDLEHWREEGDRRRQSPEAAGAASSKRRRLLPIENGSFASDYSFDSTAAANTEAAVLATLAANAETHPRIDTLEARLTDLETCVADLENSSLPSFGQPWHVEVVILPWGRHLRGIWFSALEATQQSIKSSTQASEEWNGAKEPAGKQSFRSFASGAWTTESIQAWADEAQEWLSPKACGPSSVVFQRLASRGLVQDVVLTASDSHHILTVLQSAFASILPKSDTTAPGSAQRYQGLCEDFIPLRKVRKSSRLRFLAPSELITAATWTAGFLDSSAMMKFNDGPRRLYLTTPEAYIQPSWDGWTWPRIRQLPLYDADGEEQAAQAAYVAVEACWTYNDRLDVPLSARTSFTSQASRFSRHDHDSQHAGDERGVYQDGDRARETSMPASSYAGAQSMYHGTVSAPSSPLASNMQQPVAAKRRVASFETSHPNAASQDQLSLTAAGKRRRISFSPEAERRGVGFTPRWSREPPSPFTSEHVPADILSQGTTSRKRGNTPFAYATPHSNSNYIGRTCVDLPSGDGDTEPDTDMPTAQSQRGEEEWQGVDGNLDHILPPRVRYGPMLCEPEEGEERGYDDEI